MKDEPRTPTSTHARHQLDHAVPTVIHHPEEADMPLLARWLDRAMENRTRFWGLVGGLVVVVIGLAVLANGLEAGRSLTDEAWTKIETAKTTSERVELAQEFPDTPAQSWALLQAATDYYNQGLADIPANRDAALPVLKKALDLFDRVARESAQDAPQKLAAEYGLAQTLEARNELEKAIAQYEKVAKSFKGTDEAGHAESRAQALRKPENVEFYKKLYAFKAPEMTLPPGGRSGFPFPPDHPPISGEGSSLFQSLIPSATSTLPPVFDEPKAPAKGAAPASGEIPDDVFAPAAPATAPVPAPAPEKPVAPKP